MAGMVSDRDLLSSIRDVQPTMDLDSSAFGAMTTEVLVLEMPPSLQMERVLTEEVVCLPMWLTFIPVSSS